MRTLAETEADEETAADTPPDHPTGDTDQSSTLWLFGRIRSNLGLLLAPLGILALCGVLAWYYNSLDLATAKIQIASALDWDTKLFSQIQRHLSITVKSTILVIAIAVPLGIALTRPSMRKAAPWVLTVANSGQALPAFGLLILFLSWLGQGENTAVWALTVFAILPVLRNTMVGLDQVDTAIIEAGRGMGMSKWRALRKIELPLAVPVILAGVRTALIINVGMATLAVFIGGGGLGVTIYSGIQNQQDPVLLVGTGLVAVVALTVDWLGAVAERILRPKGL